LALFVKETHQKLHKHPKVADIAPELDLFGVLAEYEQYKEMGKVIKETLKIEPGNEILKDLGNRVKAQRSKATPKK
jgi:UDP-galactopyranose mutase